jgi:flagellar M-ring protein FliF
VLSETTEQDSVAGMTQTQFEVRKKLEQYLVKKTEGMLEAVLGPGQVVVRVSTEINFDTLKKSEEKYDPDSPVQRSVTSTDETTDSTTAAPNSVPGIDANIAGDTNSLAATPQTNNRTKKKVTTQQYEINKVTSEMIQSAGSLKQLSAAVFLASRMSGSGTNRVAQPRTKEELDKIKRVVQSALGIQEGVTRESGRKDEISVEEFPFNDQSTSEVAQTLEKDQKWQLWIRIAQTAAYPLLGLVMLVTLLRLFKKSPEMDIPIGVPVGDGSQQSTTFSGKPGALRTPPGVVTVDVLNQLIRENPQNMTQAIRGWMTRGQTSEKTKS